MDWYGRMMRTDLIRIFGCWIRHRFLFILAYVIFSIFLFGFSSLFDIEQALLIYALLLLSLCWFFVLFWDFVVEFTRVRTIFDSKAISNGTVGELYLQEKVESLEWQLKRMTETYREEQVELDDYYTLWAHQMKMPIAASQLLVKELTDTDLRTQLETEIFKIEHYTNLVLNYLRLQSFHDDLVIENVEMEDVIKQLVKKYSLFFIQYRTKLELGMVCRRVKTDRRWLSLLLEQILSNALKYCQAGTISIFLEGDDIVIRDTGIGIAESDIERVFERGFSGFNGRRTQKSSGLGLYLSKKIATELGYSLQLTATVGIGTEVRIGIKEDDLVVD